MPFLRLRPRASFHKVPPSDSTSGRTARDRHLGEGVLIKATIQEGSEPQPAITVSLAPSARRALLYDRETGTLVR